MKKGLTFSLLLLFGVSLVTILYVYSNRNANTNNAFVRVFLKEKAQLKGMITLTDSRYSISEITADHITLYKFDKPSELLKVTMDLKNSSPMKLPFPSDDKKIGGLNTVERSGSMTFLVTGKMAAAYMTKDSDPLSFKTSRLDSFPFYHSEVISPNSFVFLSKFKYQGEYRRKLKKVTWEGKELASYLPSKQVDGYFSTDGQYRYCADAGRLIYMFYYRGEFTCLDTNLKEIYRAKTIDTVTQAKISLKPVMKTINGKSEIYKTVPATPPNIVNKRLCVTGNKVFIQSNLKASNEIDKDFKYNQVIDVYDLRDGHYCYSFYLPRFGLQNLTEFKIYKSSIIALYGNTLAKFTVKEIQN